MPFRPGRPGRLSVTAAVVCGLALASASAVDAATMTRQFAPTGAAQAFDVPPSVTSLDVTAVGGRGGGSGGPVVGGFGARVSGTLSVTPGQRLWVAVGGNGGGDCADATFNGGGQGGNGWCGNRGGAGGGASDVRVCAPGADCPDLDPDADPLGRLLVAGGGGGAGRWANSQAGAGGDATMAGGSRSDVRGPAGGGGGGTATAGGAGGESGEQGSPWQPTPAGAGTLGAGGIGATGLVGANTGGGGGGGGLYGGGGGGSANYYAGGGGGGSNLVPAGGNAETDATGSPSVTLSWEAGSPATIDRPSLEAPTIYADGSATTTVTVVVRDDDGVPTVGGDVSFTATGPQPQFGPTTDNGDGTYSATVTAASQRGETTITARLATPDRTSEPVTLRQIVRPTVTSPEDGTPLVPAPSGTPTFTASGTADPLTADVDLYCSTRLGLLQIAESVPVVDGRWTASDVSPAGYSHCRLVAVPAGFPVDTADRDQPGPRLRVLLLDPSTSDWTNVESYQASIGGLGAEADFHPFGYDCGVRMRSFTSDRFATGPRWLSCGASLTYLEDTFDGDAPLVVDGRPAYGVGQTSWILDPGMTGAARMSVAATVESDGTIVVTESGPLGRCTGTDQPTDYASTCGGLTGTGVTATVRTRIARSGETVTRTIDFASTDGARHDVTVTLDSEDAFDEDGELLTDDGTTARPRPSDERTEGTAARSSVLLRHRSDGDAPGLAITTVPGPTTQLLHEDGVRQRFTRAVPAGGRAGVGLTFDLAARGAIANAAAASRASYDVAVAIASPAASTRTEATTVTLSGTASDRAGQVDLRVADEPVAVAADGSWTATVPLALGANTIEAVVESAYGPRETATVTVTRAAPAPPTDPETPNPPSDPTPPGQPTPPGGGTPSVPAPPTSTPALLRQVTVPKRARLAQIRKRGLSIPITLTSPRTRITADLRGPWGAFAKTTRSQAKSGRATVRLKPSKRTLARAAKALRRSKTVRLRLTLTVRDAGNVSQTVTRTIQLRR